MQFKTGQSATINFLSLPFLLMMLFSVALVIGGCPAENAETEAPKPPRGYPSFAFIKIAYLLKLIKIVDLQPPVPETLIEYKDIEYKKIGDKSLQLDIYHRKNLDQPAPALIFIHGGGWRTGKRSDYLPYLIDFAEKGYVTVTVSYRLQKQAKFPAAVKDVKCAIKWLRVFARDYFIDPEKIAVIGGSAGGHLALMVGYSANDPYFENECEFDSVNSRVQAVVDLYGPVDLTTEYAKGRFETNDFIGKSFAEAPDLWQKASPINYLSADDPPTLIFQGTLDELVPVSQSDSLKSRLDAWGVENEYHRLKGWPHTMDIAISVNRYCQYYMNAFFEKHLRQMK